MSISPVFNKDVFGSKVSTGNRIHNASVSFAELLGSIVVRELRSSVNLFGADHLAGEIFGGFLDLGIAEKLAGSPALEPIVASLDESIEKTHLIPTGGETGLGADLRGPVLLPPEPSKLLPLPPPPDEV